MVSASKKQLEEQISILQKQLDGLSPMEAMGVRELARAADVSPTTAMRAKRGEILSAQNMVKLLPFMNKCPCCQREISDAEKQKMETVFTERKN